jgi:hypothetical protein
MWTCPKCGTKVDDSYDVCWACGTTRDGVEDPSFVRADAPPPDVSPLDLDMPPGDDPLPAPSNPLGADLVEAYWALDLMQAKFLADQLSEQGIPAVSDTHDLHEALGSLSSVPRVWVRAEDLPRAKAWLDAYDEQYKAEHGAPDRD